MKLHRFEDGTGFARINAYNAVGDLCIATGGLQLDDYSIYQMYDNEMNYEANLNFKKTFDVISLHGFVGTTLRKNSSQYLFNSTEVLRPMHKDTILPGISRHDRAIHSSEIIVTCK